MHATRPFRRRWFRIPPLPGRKRDYYLLVLAGIDIILLQLSQSFDVIVSRQGRFLAIGFDIFVLSLWGIDLLMRTLKAENRLDYLKRHWYEIAGIVPFQIMRFLLLLRGAKLAIAFYKLGRTDEEISQSLTREITFRFRDIIVDSIADAVFLQSLRRVEEVMMRLDYAALARRAFHNHQEELTATVKESLLSKSMMGELARVPFMQAFVDRTGEEVSTVITEVLEARVSGEIMREITREVLAAMYDRVQRLDLERLTRPEDAPPDHPKPPTRP